MRPALPQCRDGPISRILTRACSPGSAMFVWESIAHMVLPVGEMGHFEPARRTAVRAALAAGIGKPTDSISTRRQWATTPIRAGPWGLLLLPPALELQLSAVIGWEALTELVQGVALALLIAMAAAASFGKRLGIAVWSASRRRLPSARPTRSGSASRSPTRPGR